MPTTEKLKQEIADAEKKLAQERSRLRRLIASPLRRGGRLVGFVGVDNPRTGIHDDTQVRSRGARTKEKPLSVKVSGTPVDAGNPGAFFAGFLPAGSFPRSWRRGFLDPAAGEDPPGESGQRGEAGSGTPRRAEESGQRGAEKGKRQRAPRAGQREAGKGAPGSDRPCRADRQIA